MLNSSHKNLLPEKNTTWGRWEKEGKVEIFYVQAERTLASFYSASPYLSIMFKN
jgi:hypothetical protein